MVIQDAVLRKPQLERQQVEDPDHGQGHHDSESQFQHLPRRGGLQIPALPPQRDAQDRGPEDHGDDRGDVDDALENKLPQPGTFGRLQGIQAHGQHWYPERQQQQRTVNCENDVRDVPMPPPLGQLCHDAIPMLDVLAFLLWTQHKVIHSLVQFHEPRDREGVHDDVGGVDALGQLQRRAHREGRRHQHRARDLAAVYQHLPLEMVLLCLGECGLHHQLHARPPEIQAQQPQARQAHRDAGQAHAVVPLGRRPYVERVLDHGIGHRRPRAVVVPLVEARSVVHVGLPSPPID
mmetsp:Transcript_5748/g.17008  ORF Transcript_5748/g.17008 Transcript_5748/m.17008 type:complete len:292 (-) Transcript_5748:133-1008(-)